VQQRLAAITFAAPQMPVHVVLPVDSFIAK
jgi:hypothetical protein